MPRNANPTDSIPNHSELRRRPVTAARAAGPTNGDGARLRIDPRPAPADRDGYEAACLPLSGELFGAAMRLTRNPDDARDLVQETLLRAMQAWSRFEVGSNVRAWLHRILTNSFINGYRKRRRHQRFATERPGDARAAVYGTDDDHTGDLEDALTETQLSDEVQVALAKLGPDYREVVARADLGGEKYKDIADALDLPIGTVMSRLFRARRQLEDDLRDFAAKDWGLARAA